MTVSSPSMLAWIIIGVSTGTALAFAYLLRLNHLMKGVPDEVQKLATPLWTTEQLRGTYDTLEKHPIDYTSKIPPKLDRRYIVTGGNGLVGGYIVLQLLARGTPVANIRIIDVRRSERTDMASGPPAMVDFVKTDIRSVASVSAAFTKPWDPSAAHLPLTVFHTAAVILAADRSPHLYAFPYAVNVEGTKNVLNAAKAAGADIFSFTSSASISIRPMNPWVPIWAKEMGTYWQLLHERDFDQPLRMPNEYSGVYPLTKATAERLVCAANSDEFRTACIRPANAVYGNPTDNVVGGLLHRSVAVTWIPHIVQSFVHGANIAIAHLQQEAVLLSKDHVDDIQQAGRPFVVTDPNPPITYMHIYTAIGTLSIYPLRVQIMAPAFILVMAYVVEWYHLLPYRVPLLKGFLPEIKGDARHLQPGIITNCTHLIATDTMASKPVAQGGLGYEGVVTTLQGMVSEILDWNRENETEEETRSEGITAKTKKLYTTSMALADQLRQVITT